jgi:tetratricopeptide (TPR) repeat protein
VTEGPRWNAHTVCHEAHGLSPADRDALDARIGEDPTDLHARLRRVGYDFYHQRSRSHDLEWLVRHHPGLELSAFETLRRANDPEAYERLRALWFEHLRGQPDNLTFLSRAAALSSLDHPDDAERWLLRRVELSPSSKTLSDLAQFYLREAEFSEGPERRKLGARAVNAGEGAVALAEDAFAAQSLLAKVAEAAIFAEDHARAESAANALLERAPRFVDTWAYGNFLHGGHIVLGHVALARGDLPLASRHLREAGATPGSPQLGSFGPDLALASALLAQGVRDEVIGYLVDCTKFWKTLDLQQLERWCARIRTGETFVLELDFGDDDDDDDAPDGKLV